MNISISNYLEALALLVSIASLARLRLSSLKYFPVFLALTVFVELGSKYLRMSNPSLNVSIVYNIFIAFQIAFFLFLLYNESFTSYRKKIILSLTLFYLFFYLFNLNFIQGYNIFNYYSYLVGSFFVVVSSLFYLSELIALPDEVQLFSRPMFWITTAALVFFTGTFFYFLFYYFLVFKKMDANGSLFRSILTILNVLFYSLLIIGFLCSEKKTKQY